MAPSHECAHVKDQPWKLPSSPITSERPPPQDLHSRVEHPACPRANAAPSAENPHPQSTDQLTVLEAHCAFFDRDHDGVVFPPDTFRGLHAIGFNWFLAALGAWLIHASFSYYTSESWIPDLRLPINLKRMHRCKHGGDTETYDTEGRFVPAHFEEIFSKYAKQHGGDKLSLADLFGMIAAKRNINDPVGWVSSSLEWWALWWVAQDEQGLLSKERVRASYDGSLWFILEREYARKREAGRKQRRAAPRAQPHKIRATD